MGRCPPESDFPALDVDVQTDEDCAVMDQMGYSNHPHEQQQTRLLHRISKSMEKVDSPNMR
eukprot:756604-Hanusia_phi.AAC.4